MFKVILILYLTWTVTHAQDYYFRSHNVNGTTLSDLAAYRSTLTLDWLAAEDFRQRDLVAAFETDAPPARFISADCVTYPKPAPGKIGRLMLELLKNLEGDDGILIPELIQVLIRSKLLVETSALEMEPDLESLVKTPELMVGEPHATFPRIMAVIWMLVTDPVTTRKYGWCPVKQVNKYLAVAKAKDAAKRMKALEVIVARARFVMEEFIQNITPVNMYPKKRKMLIKPKRPEILEQRRLQKRLQSNLKPLLMEPVHQLALRQSPVLPGEVESNPTFDVINSSFIMVSSSVFRLQSKFLLPIVCCFIIKCF